MGLIHITGAARQDTGRARPVNIPKDSTAEKPPQSPPARGDRQTLTAAARAGAAPLEDVDYESFLRDLLGRLNQSAEGITVSVGAFSGDGLYEAAAGLGQGTHLLVSPEFLRRMAESTEAYGKGKLVLEEVLRALNGYSQGDGTLGAYTDETAVTFWSGGQAEQAAGLDQNTPPTAWEQEASGDQRLLELMKETFARAKETKSKWKLKVSSSLYNAGSEAMARLAKAKTTVDAKAAASMAKRSIGSLKIALSLCEEKDKARIRATVQSLEKVVARSARKVRDLDGEALVRARQEKAEQAKQRRRAEQAKFELQQRKTARRSREHAQVKLAQGEEWSWAMREAERRADEELRDAFAPGAVPADGVSPAGAESAGQGGGAAPAEPAISFAPAAEFLL